MPKGSKGQKRPADVIGNAVRVMQIATGQREEEYESDEAPNSALVSAWPRLSANKSKACLP
jgi:hypothetical protein